MLPNTSLLKLAKSISVIIAKGGVRGRLKNQ